MHTRHVIAALAAAATAASLAAAQPAAARTVTTTTTYTDPGDHVLIVPADTYDLELDALGGAGYPGDDSATQFSTGGAAGHGTHVHETVRVRPGDSLRVVVGAKGGGGQRGYGSELSGSGGNGGGATYVIDLTTGVLLLVAGGGGGGGGGGGSYYLYDGGNGGTAGPGTPGIGTAGGDAGRGGAEGQPGTCGDSGISQGGTGESAPTASGVAGGGGGGQGACGGQSGGSGEHGAGAGGGGGGGAGASFTHPAAVDPLIEPGSNAGNGSASLTFTSFVRAAPTITSPACVYAGDVSAPHVLAQPVTALGYPAPNLTLLNAPAWLAIRDYYPYASGGDTGTAADLGTSAPIPAPQQYLLAVQASNAVASVIQPLTVVAGVDHRAFVSPDHATATAGQPFTLQTKALGCPSVQEYSLTRSEAGTDWLSIDPQSGLVSGTPGPAEVGTHHVDVVANAGATGTLVTQTLTVTVNPAPATVPGAPTQVTATAHNGRATVAFAAPADDGGAPITGYTVTATDQTATARGGQTATGAVSPLTVRGLTNGDRYTFTVAAGNAQGVGPASAPSAPVTPRADRSAVTITAPRSVRHGARVTVSAELTDSTTRTPLRSQPVTLYRRPSPTATWQRVTTVTTSATGAAWVALTVRANAQLRYAYAGTPAHAPAASRIATVTVRPVVRIHHGTAHPRHHRAARIWGTVRPVDAGHHVTLQRRLHGRWRAVATTTLRKRNLPDGRTGVGYVFDIRPRSAGAYRVYVPPTRGLAAGTSPAVTVRVTG